MTRVFEDGNKNFGTHETEVVPLMGKLFEDAGADLAHLFALVNGQALRYLLSHPGDHVLLGLDDDAVYVPQRIVQV